MSDPVAEAAAQLAAQQNEPSLITEIKEGMHDLAEKVEHLIHPEAGTAAAGEQSGTLHSGSVSNEAPNVVAGTPPVGDATPVAGDLPNAASAAGAPTAAQDSASNAAGADTAKSSDANSVEPLHVRIAAHLEAIFQMAKDEPKAVVADTSALKTHVGDILHRISNGMAVTEGELVAKLEALYRML